mmetsp:Transcript_29889/g.55891  ORF Transcript_29889/g.55891 Transcript_29889/m.55891 type:complete len:136 (-) Transcript_29889:154-561(-)
MFEQNQHNVKEYLRKKAERENEANGTSQVTFPGLDHDELMRLWRSSDVAEVRAAFDSAFQVHKSESNEGAAEDIAQESMKDQIMQRLQEMRLKHDIEAKRMLVRATRAILADKKRIEELKQTGGQAGNTDQTGGQ